MTEWRAAYLTLFLRRNTVKVFKHPTGSLKIEPYQREKREVMQGVEISHCNAAIEAMLNASYAFWMSTVDEALRPILTYGKTDTLGMDAMPEITIIDTLARYDRNAIVITEETGSLEQVHFAETNDFRRFRTVFICDPTDRSSQIQRFLEGVKDRSRLVGDVIREEGTFKRWEESCHSPVVITGGYSAVTCIRRGAPIFAVLVNYLTHQLIVSCSAGNFVLDLPEAFTKIDLDRVASYGKRITFRDINNHGDMRRFVTFMGKSLYKENFMDSGLMSEKEMTDFLHYNLPGGPSRMLYLSNFQNPEMPIGFILANGEKIGEWIHWIPFIRFALKERDQSAAALRLFEIHHKRPWTKEGILMSTPPSYSVFDRVNGSEKEGLIINVGKFNQYPNPSQYRSTLIVTPPDNQWAIRVATQYGYRPINIYNENSSL